MKCCRCGDDLEKENIYKIRWEKFCEDCYIDETLPKHPCDPMAQMAMENFMETFKRSPMEEISDRQKKIYEFIKDRGKVTREEVANEFHIRELDLMQDFIILRRLGLAKSKKMEGTIYLTLWD